MYLLILLIGIYLNLPWWFWVAYVVMFLVHCEKEVEE